MVTKSLLYDQQLKKKQCLASLKFGPSSSWLTLCQIRVHTSCKLFVVHQLLFADCRCLILGASALNISSAVFIETCKIVAMMTSFDLKHSDLLAPNLHIKEVLYGPTYLLTSCFCRDSRGVLSAPPPSSPVCAMLIPSPRSVLNIVLNCILNRFICVGR